MTEIEITPSAHRIRLSDSLVLMGSCFAQEMGEWFQERRFSMCLNPNGIVFHPAVMARCTRKILNETDYLNEEWIEYNGLFHSFDHHGSFSERDADSLTRHANQSMQFAHQALCNASTLVITWGSAWGYTWNESGQWVANCHKIPQSRFTKQMIDSDTIVAEWTELLNLLIELNPKINVVISISPVRYWRDGAHGNQLSKANLLIAANKLADAWTNVHYFPAYEIMLDELRDYRFYASDLLHPSPIAVEHIIGKFQAMFFSEETKDYIFKIEPHLKFLRHRPLHVSDDEWQLRCKEKELEIERLRNANG